MTDFKTLEKRLLKDPEVARLAKELEPQYQLARELIKARLKAKMTQAEVAEKMNTSQAAVSRMESAASMPSFKSITRYAEAVGRKPVVRLVPD